jgi:hypothetical protein
MKKLLLPILLFASFLVNAQEVKFISVNAADTTLEEISFKRLPKLLAKDSITSDTLQPVRWMQKLPRKLSCKQRKDSNIYIFFIPSAKDSISVYLPLSGKYGYVLFDTAKTGVTELESLQLRLSTWKYQWDLIHDPQTMLFAWAQDEEEGAYYSEQNLIKFINYIRERNKKGYGYASLPDSVVRNIDIIDQYIIDNYSPDELSEGMLNTKTVLNYFVPEGAVDTNVDAVTGAAIVYSPELIKALLEKKAKDEVEVGDDSSVLLAKEMQINMGNGNSYKLTVNGFSMTDKIISLYAKEEVNGQTKKYTFYNGKLGAREKYNKLDESHDVNNRKAFEIIVHKETGLSFKKYIKLKGILTLTENQDVALGDSIIIEIRRKQSNEFISIGEIKVLGTDLEGVTMELGYGTNAQCNSGCTETKRDKFECKRIPAGTYPFTLNTQITKSGQHTYKSLRLNTSGTGRGGILLHRGTSYAWSQGCILAMHSNVQDELLADPSSLLDSTKMAVKSSATDILASQAFVLLLYDYVESKDTNNKRPKIVRIIDEDKGTELTVGLSIFKGRQQAGRVYHNYDDSITIKSTEALLELTKQRINNLLNTHNAEQQLQNKKDEIVGNNTNSELNIAQLRDSLNTLWGTIIESHNEYTEASIESYLKGKTPKSNYQNKLKQKTKQVLNNNSVDDVDEVIDNMFLETKSSPYSPIQKYYLRNYNTKVNNAVNSEYITNYLNTKRDGAVDDIINSIISETNDSDGIEGQ